MGTSSKERYVTALRYDGLTSLYDPILQLTMREKIFKGRLIEQANIQKDQRVLDLGCGTATLTIMIKQIQPSSDVVGLDGDVKILKIGRQKIENRGLDIALQVGLSFDTMFPDNSFDRVISSLLFHHLLPADKRRTAAEVYRILKLGGELHIADWGRPSNSLMRAAFLGVQLLDGFAATTENIQGKLPDYMQEAGFQDVTETDRLNTVFGTLGLYKATKN